MSGNGTAESEDSIAVTSESASEIEDFVKTFVFGREVSASKQIDQGTSDYGDRAIAPPYNPLLWAQLMEKSTRLQSCIHAMADNTVGLGWRIVPIKKITKSTPPAVRAAIEAETEFLETVFSRPNDDMPFTEMWRLEKIDEEATGTGYIEVLRDLQGVMPCGFVHVAAHTMRVDKLGGFIQRRNGSTRFFKDFNEQRDKHAITGDYYAMGTLNEEDRATEVIPFRLYGPRDSYYGIPRVVCAAPAVTGNRLAAIRNAAFFENDAVPRLAFLISGGHLSENSAKSIKEFLQSDAKGPSNAHRVMVVEAEGKKVAVGGKQEPVRIALEKLTVGETDDASFLQYRAANDEEIREAFRIAEVFLGTTDKLNRASAYVARKTTIEQVFKPEQIKKEYIINHKILAAMGIKYVRFEFNRAKSEDPVEMAPADSVHGRFGALTPNDIRQERGLDPYPEDSGFGDIPFDLERIRWQAQVMGKAAEGQPNALANSLMGLRSSLAAKIQAERLSDDEEDPEVTA